MIPKLPRLECPFKKSRREAKQESAPRSLEDEFKDFKHFVDPGYKQYERFFANVGGSTSSTSVYVHNVSNDSVQNKSQDEVKQDDLKLPIQSAEEKEDAAIDEAIRQLAHIVGELEFQMGLESVSAGDYFGAVDHFRLSTNHNHPGGIFNLALCYEQGVGVKKNMKTAKRLYEIASELGHAKAFYNLGVFHAQGLGGVHKDFLQAKKCFEQAAGLGNSDALEALRLLLPPKKLPVIQEAPDDDFFFAEKSIMSKTMSAMNQNNRAMQRIAMT